MGLETNNLYNMIKKEYDPSSWKKEKKSYIYLYIYI